MRGTKLGSYELVSKLGEGGMGAVYLAKHHLIGRKAAVKVLLPELSQNKDAVERFFNEARAATLVQHPGIVDVFDFGVSDRGAYLVMEFLDGETLGDRMARLGKIPEKDTLRLARQAANALDAAHREGIIHRDLKPDNLIAVPDSEVPGGERVKILDFGIAKLTGDDPEGATKTRTGAIMGTPYYMAPEQCAGAGGELDARVDVYALGCVIYEMLCSAPPFDGSGTGEVIAKHIYEPPPSPRAFAQDVSEATASLVVKCLAKDPGERFASMDALASALATARTGEGAEASIASVATADTIAETVAATPGAGASTPAENPPLRASVDAIGPATHDPATRRKSVAFIGTSALVVIAAVGALMWLRHGAPASDAGAESTARGDTEQARDPAFKAPAVANASPAAGSAHAEHAPDARSPGRPTVQFAITSEPRGALVQDRDEAILGVTPLDLEVAKDGDPITYTVRAPEYELARVELVADRDREKKVTLTRSVEHPSEEAKVRERAPRDRQPDARRGPSPGKAETANDDARAGEKAGIPSEDEDPFGSRR